MEALTNYMKTAPAIKNVYLINQDYSFGESVRSAAKSMLAAKRPDIKIVGDELHPLFKITDFAPYIAKIKASGADTVVTGNWGQDFALLLKAAADTGLKVNWYTYYAGGTGGPTAIKQANLNHQVFQVGEGIPNLDHASSQEFEKAIRAKYDFSVFYPRAVNEMRMLACRGRQGQVDRPGQGRDGARRHGVRSVRRRQGQHAQGRSPVLPADLYFLARRTHRKGTVRRGEDRLGLEARCEDRYARDRASDHLQDGTAELTVARVTRPSRNSLRDGCVSYSRRCVLLELIVISTLNGVLFGMLLFLMASGLTVIFSMLGVLNFAHASFYMLGAFFGFQISRWFGFWPALLVAPLLAGAIGAGVERYGLRPVHKNGHVAELLFTFGLAFVIEEVVQIVWGKSPVDFRVPPLLDFPAFTIFSTNYPAYKMFMLLVSIAIFAGLLLVLKKTRIGLIVQAALTHPHMVGHLGHNVGRIFMLVFGVGTALAAVAGVIAGPALVTQSNMAGLLGPILFVVVVVGGLGSLSGAFVASLADRPGPDLCGFDERLAVRRLRSARACLRFDMAF